MRGTVIGAADVAKEKRITPACAGNRKTPFGLPLLLQDHPRVCGEQRLTILFLVNVGGSPPRVRGTVKDPLLNAMGVGITPACAGNSWDREGWCIMHEDHPRVCGEQYIIFC